VTFAVTAFVADTDPTLTSPCSFQVKPGKDAQRSPSSISAFFNSSPPLFQASSRRSGQPSSSSCRGLFVPAGHHKTTSGLRLARPGLLPSLCIAPVIWPFDYPSPQRAVRPRTQAITSGSTRLDAGVWSPGFQQAESALQGSAGDHHPPIPCPTKLQTLAPLPHGRLQWSPLVWMPPA